MKHLPDIYIKIINHSKQAYDTCGDYWVTKKGNWTFRVSQMRPEYSMAILIHELFEMLDTQLKGIKEEDITKFDIESGLDDPGFSKEAPYHISHMSAERIEKLVIKEFGLRWKEYEECINKLKY